LKSILGKLVPDFLERPSSINGSEKGAMEYHLSIVDIPSDTKNDDG
jgi:hypothetical protein